MNEKAWQFENVRRIEPWLRGDLADEIEVNYSAYDERLYRFAVNTVHQPQHLRIHELSCRGVWGQSTSRGVVRGDDSIRAEGFYQDLKERAAIVGHAVRFLPMLQPPVDYPSVHRWDPAVEGDQLVYDLMDLVFSGAKEYRAQASGFVALRYHYEAYANTHGIFTQHTWTTWELSLTLECPEGSFYTECSHWRWKPELVRSRLDRLNLLIQTRFQRVERPPGAYPVILLPTAFADLLEFVTWGMNGLEVHEGSSYLSGRLNDVVFGGNVTIEDRWNHEDHDGLHFDGEGVAKKVVSMVVNGRFVQPVYDRLTAKEVNAEPTGHGLPVPNPWGAMVTAPYVHGDGHSLTELMRIMGEGILIPRSWYVRLVDPQTVTLTGMTRDGAVWVSGGRPVALIRDMRFNQSMIEALSGKIAKGIPERAGEEFGKAVVPPVLIESFNMVEIVH